MQGGGDDISWAELCRIASPWAGASAGLMEVVALQGGSVSTTLLLRTDDGRSAVCKVTPHRVDRSLLTEAHHLRLLAGHGLPVPRVFAAELASLEQPNSYLLMECVDGMTLGEARKGAAPETLAALQAELAEIVATLHAVTGDAYGKIDGAGLAPVNATDNWPTFFRTLHDAVVDGARQQATIPAKILRKIDKLHDRLDYYLRHGDRPRLLHGDLWGGNVLCRREGDRLRVAALIDPKLRFGHAEYELAYMELFDTSTRDFRRAYRAQHAIDDGYQKVRKPIYQLYPLVHHVNVFGPQYVPPLLKVVEQVTAVL